MVTNQVQSQPDDFSVQGSCQNQTDISVLTEFLPFGCISVTIPYVFSHFPSPVKLGRFCDFTKTVGFLGIKLPQINPQPEALLRVPQDREYSLVMVILVQLLLQTKITLN